MVKKWIKLFLRVALGVTFLSAVADRFGLWNQNVAWGDWDSFTRYTQELLPWLSSGLVTVAAVIATLAEIVLGVALLIGWKLRLMGTLSGILLLLFGLAMAATLGIKAPLDFSVFSAAAAAFALTTIKGRFLEI